MSKVMRPVIGLLALALIGAAVWYFWPRSHDDRWLGYVEGETLYVAAPISGRLQSLGVERGAEVAAGAPLFSLDPETTDADTARVAAELAAAQASAADLTAPRQRPAELAQSQAAIAAANAALTKAQRDFERVSALALRGFASRSQLDAARAARDGAAAQLSGARAQVASGELTAGREAQQRAAQAQASGAEAGLRAQRQRRREIAPVSPAAGVVEQTYFNPGEWVPANSPVVAVLPDSRRKLRFYVPEAQIANLRPGAAIRFTCDGCGAVREARISYISPRAEYTPPVIYSERARSKLVFLVEAALPPSAKPLPPGLPIEVEPQ